MKQTVEEAASENILFNHRTVDRTLSGKDLAKFGEMNFVQGAEWKSKQSPWVSVKIRLPNEYEDIIILCKHGAIFNGTYSNNVWFCMDGYIHDMYKGNPIYSSMSSIPPLWEPIAWMPKPKFEE